MLSVKLHSMLQNILDLNFKITYFICYSQKDNAKSNYVWLHSLLIENVEKWFFNSFHNNIYIFLSL